MPEQLPNYEIFAIKYAERDGTRSHSFLSGDAHDGPMPMDYFVWAIKSPEKTIIVDCGFTGETAARLHRTLVRDSVDCFELVGINPQTVDDVIITHLHYDHVGGCHRFDRANFHIQERELQFATGRYMRYKGLSYPFLVEDIVNIVRLNFEGRVTHHSGIVELAPGITLHPVGGHTPGTQFVRVHTARGWVALASDVTHFYENVESNRPFPGVTSLPEMLEGFDTLRAAADSPSHIIPGHDPLVLQRYPPVSPELKDIAVRVDLAPIA